MAIWPANPWFRRTVIAAVAGLCAAVGLLKFDGFLVAHGAPKEGTYLDDILIGLLVGAFAVGLDLYHHLRVTRVRQAAVLMGQLDHHIRNSLQAIVLSSSMPQHSASQDAVRAAVGRIEWALAKFPKENEIFAEARNYLSDRMEDLNL
jgi:hypothetical protein